MRRKLVTLCSAVSLVLCLVGLVLWLGGYSGSPSPVWRETKPIAERRYSIGVSGGAVHFDVIKPSATPSDGRSGTSAFGVGHSPPVPAYALSPTGGPNIYLGESESVSVRLWLLVLVTAVPPAAWIALRVRAWWIVAPGHCASCGYDLRATPERCPECGTVPQVAETAA